MKYRRFAFALLAVVLLVCGGLYSGRHEWWGPVLSFVGALIVGRLI